MRASCESDTGDARMNARMVPVTVIKDPEGLKPAWGTRAKSEKC